MNYGRYFDSAATTPLHPEAWKEMESVRDIFGNASSRHEEGFRTRKKMDEYLQRIADCLGVARDQVIITHGGTDANRKVLWAMRKRSGHENLWCSRVEHSSISDEILEDHQFHPRSWEGLPSSPQFLALMQANNETGEIFDVGGLRKKFPDAIILSDWVQGIGKMKIDLSDVDFASIAAHKFYGPKGVGILYCKNPEQFQDLAKDTHTKDLIGVAGMTKALEMLSSENATMLQKQTEAIEKFIQDNIPDSKIHAEKFSRVPGILNVAFRGIRGSELMSRLSEEEGICISTGAACTSDILAPPRVIQVIEEDPDWQYPIRIGLHRFLTEKDIQDFCEVLVHYVEEMRD
ncbi:aminotransferase class V-fold PLP-dependent enzyme [Candidatus Gracilibacteria bacterium]|nr:aminotransferase class V-fold PLP-dependent enzyme [Candidatus Gracilibacteria bacterium]MCF7819120.1 aminotransferase class V-fold PLP-dependent enzyme [Candidatus Gracilibacteria bacterium]